MSDALQQTEDDSSCLCWRQNELIAVVDIMARSEQRLRPPVGARSYCSASHRYRFSGTRTPSQPSICAQPKRHLCVPAAVSFRPISNPNTSPCSLRRSGWSGTAWQDEHPPALKARRPLARSGVRAGSFSGKTTAGMVSTQKIKMPVAAAIMNPRKIRRSIDQSVTTGSVPKASGSILTFASHCSGHLREC